MRISENLECISISQGYNFRPRKQLLQFLVQNGRPCSLRIFANFDFFCFLLLQLLAGDHFRSRKRFSGIFGSFSVRVDFG